eukprot:TRINITY_DN12265_c0_g1_i1.p1 TRINITY_DN12265_c0_g1~~TRINITY_DN12265_c0_g1_i1.p1  ORF type:complete len:721 (-),score=155.29 TRINITY_DN12265_c0_g1_i1:221-2383(-)
MYGTGWDQDRPLNLNTKGHAASKQQQDQFYTFIKMFTKGGTSVYREQLTKHHRLGQHFLEVHLEDVLNYSQARGLDLGFGLQQQPLVFLKMFESAAKVLVSEIFNLLPERTPDVQVLLHAVKNRDRPLAIRDCETSQMVSKLVQVPGIVISMSKVQAKATSLCLVCKDCSTQKWIVVKPGFGGAELPSYCDSGSGAGKKCKLNPYVIVPDETTFMNQQILKLQDLPENVPTGEMPRHFDLIVDRNLVGRAVPGTRIEATGVLTLFQGSRRDMGGSVANLRDTYLQVVGILVDGDGTGRTRDNFSKTEVQHFQELSRSPNLYSKIVQSLAPAIYGHEDIKKALACQLFGGCHKDLMDGARLRGDINILLLGDPGTAKSQMLKFVEKVSPIAVYTSGKGSSAAGLTASVKREASSREFFLEGGAMVLADGGIVCIDEFDKMRVQDRVAIHEAMEQQTISIAKAGITTILNSRTAVLAAANPNFGSYDDSRSNSENFEEFRTTILSRFDCIFLIRDRRNADHDQTIAAHVIRIHMNAHDQSEVDVPIPLDVLKRYISYARRNCDPRLTPKAMEVLSNKYVSLRTKHRDRELSGSNAIPITVRQLEAIIRLSEALAKMTLSPMAHETHVEEALRLFNVSTVDAINSGQIISEVVSDKIREDIELVEKSIRTKLAHGSIIGTKRLVTTILSQYNVPENIIRRALEIMAQKGELQFQSLGKRVKRI